MASKRIKGITIQIGGDTTKLSAALKGVDKTISQTETKLRDVNKLLKFNPTSAELLKQKQQALGTEITATKDKLEKEKEALAELEKSADGSKENAEQQAALKREIEETTNKLKYLEKEARAASSVLGSQMQAAGKKISETGDKIIGVGKKLSKVSAGFAAVGGAAVKAANDYENGLNKVNTIAGLTGAEFEKMGDDLLKVSSETGKAATEITEAAYQALSASVPTEQVADFVNTSAKLAKAGFTETATAVDVLTTAINAYGLETSDAEALANKLVQVQNDGKTTVDQLAASMGNVIPTASALGVNFNELSAMYVLMTKQGINTKNATTAIRGTLNELSNSGKGAGETLTALTGKTFGQLIKEGNDVSDVLKILYDSVDGDSEAFKNLFGNVKAGQGALAIMNQGTDAYKTSLDNVANSAGNVDAALNTMSTPLKTAQKALNDTKNSAITLGQAGLEAAAPTIKSFSDTLTKLNDKFQNLDKKQQNTIVKFGAIGAAIGPATVAVGGFVKGVGNIADGVGKAISGISGLLVKFGLKTAAEVSDTAAVTANTAAEGANAAATAASGTAATGASGGFLALNASMLPTILIIGAIVVAVAAVIAAIVLLVKNWDKVSAALKKGVEKVKAFFTNLKEHIKTLFGNIGQWFGEKFSAAASAVKEKFAKIKEFFSGVKDKVVGIFKSIGQAIGSAVSTAFKSIINGALTIAENYINFIPNSFNKFRGIINNIPGVDIPAMSTVKLPRLKKGGITTEATLALLGDNKSHKEGVIPFDDPRALKMLTDALGGTGAGTTVNQTFNIGEMSSYREAYLIRRATEQGIKKVARATV